MDTKPNAANSGVVDQLAEQSPRQSQQQAVSAIHQYMTAGRLKQALQLALQLTQTQPKRGEYWRLLSEVQSKPALKIDPMPAIRRAIELTPQNSLCQAQLAHCHALAGNFAEAQAVVGAVLLRDGLDAFTLDKLGFVLNSCGELSTAHRCYERAVELQPENHHFLFNLATLQRSLGKIAESEASFDRIIAISPDDTMAQLARSSLRTVSPDNNHVDELQACLQKLVDKPDSEIRLCFSLTKELEDIGNYSQAFHYLQRGSDVRRKRMAYKVESDVDAMAKIAEVFSAEQLQAIESGYDTEEPIFILGLPRTGTTLVERILSSHSDVFAAGELQNFAIELVKQTRQSFTGEPLDRSQLIEKTAQLDYRLLGERYLQSTRPRTGHQPHFIDKLPLNFLYTGLIQRALPKAKIIHLTRNPMDACYAIYKTLFEQTYPFSYNLDDMASYYIAYRRLMAHWQQVMGSNIFNLSYEALVADQEGVSRQLLEFCGLTWQANCLDFKNNRTPTSTASASQVRQGLYSSSVERWRCYSEELAPLQAQLSEAGIDPLSW